VFPTFKEAQEARDKYLKEHGYGVSAADNVIKGKGKSIVCLFDLHVPYHHKESLSIARQIIKDVQPEDVIFGGDVVDFFQLSTFNNDTSRAKTTQQELDEWYDVAKEIKECAKNATFYHIIGNHEKRLQNWLNANGGLDSLRALKLESLLRLDELGIEHGRVVSYLNNRLVILHGRYYSSIQGSAAKKECKTRAFQQSILMGHVHHCGQFEMNGPISKVVGYEVGALCVDSWYSQDDKFWQRGIAVITIDGDNFDVELIRIENNKALFRGKVYKG
jgi:predicted phosphodiesterase